MNEFTLNDSGCQMNELGCRRNSLLKLSTFDWLCDLPETVRETDLVEVQFKNTRKGYYINTEHLPLKKGDMVSVTGRLRYTKFHGSDGLDHNSTEILAKKLSIIEDEDELLCEM